MIYLFRKEIKKWHAVLWVVFVSLAIGSGLSLIFWRSPQGADDYSIATINGKPIPFKKYKKALVSLQYSIQMLQQYAKMYGMSEDVFLRSFFGNSNPNKIALNNCIKEALMDSVKDSLNIVVNTKYMQEQIIKSLPKGIVDAQGNVNMDSYQHYLQNINKTPTEYEEEQGEMVKQKLVERLINNSFYYPFYAAKNQAMNNNATKSFSVVKLSFDSFLKVAEKETISKKDIKEFYIKHKERYRVPENKKVNYWKLSIHEYAKNLAISDNAIKTFYNKNKTAMFRNPPKVNIRRLVLNVPTQATEKKRKDVLAKAERIHQAVKKKPASFVDYVRDYSDDEQALKAGGLTGFFKRGTYHPAIEKAAFRLQNKGDISDIIKTNRGYEILQLEDRLKATYKPLEKVKDEIVKTLKSKKALSEIKSKLSIMMHKARSDKNQIATFVKQHNLKTENSGWLNSSVNGKTGIIRHLAQKLFVPNKRTRTYGYFFYEGNYVIYQQTDIKKSYIKKLDYVMDDVKKHYQYTSAKDAIQSEAKKIKISLFHNKKGSLAEAAEGHESFKINKMVKSDPIKAFKDNKIIKDRMFALTGDNQILQYKDGDSIFLIQLSNIEEGKDSKKIQDEISSIIKNEKIKNSHLQSVAFIASLQRNANIEVDDKILKLGSRIRLSR